METLLTTAAIATVLSMPAHAQTDNDPNNFWVKHDKGWRFHIIDETKLVGKLKPPPKPKYTIDRFGVTTQDTSPPVTTGASGSGGNDTDTVHIDMYPGFAIQYKAPKPFMSAVVGNPAVADAQPTSDQDLVIQSKPEGGETNIVLTDSNGVRVANVWIHVTPATARVEDGKVRIHDKLNDITAFTNYQCSATGCTRAQDKMEGSDRAKPPSTVISIGDYTSRSTVTTKSP
jgi:Flp pilus assembly secretin CpaC